MRYRLAIFDFDGTIADSFPSFLRISADIAAKYKLKGFEERDIETLRGLDARTLIKRAGVPWWKLPQIGNDARRMMASDIANITLFDGVAEVLHRLAQGGVTLAVVTSNSLPNVTRVLGPEQASLISYYECGSSLFGKQGRYRKILKASGIEPGDTISIGDEIRDVEAARQAGIAFGAVAWGYTTVDALAAQLPAAVFAHPHEIVEKLL